MLEELDVVTVELDELDVELDEELDVADESALEDKEVVDEEGAVEVV